MSALAINAVPVSRKFHDNVIELYPDKEHEFVMTTAQVAKGYGVTDNVVRSHKANHSDEIHEGKHFFCVEKINAKKKSFKQTFWTKLGVIYLGFFIKSERAKQFRKFAADLVLDTIEKKQPRKALGKGIELPETNTAPVLSTLKGLQIMSVTSDSMSSEYHVGETIFFDPKKTRGDGVFVVRIGNMIDIRRVQHFVDRNLIGLKRSNPLYGDSVDLLEPTTPHLTVIGMVVGKIQKGYV